jgi:hypothetical protein
MLEDLAIQLSRAISCRRRFTFAAAILTLILGVGAPAVKANEAPSVILGEGTLAGHEWQTGASARRDGRSCFWIRFRLGAVEVPSQMCAGPRSYPHFAVLADRGTDQVAVELLIAPVRAARVHINLVGQPDRDVRLVRVNRSDARAVGLKPNFRYATETYTGGFCIRRAIYYDKSGSVVHRGPRSTDCSSSSGPAYSS